MASQTKTSEQGLYLEYTLRLTKSRIRMVDVLSAGLLMLAILIAVLLSMVICDHYIPGGVSAGARRVVRWSLLVFEAGLAGALIVWPLLRRINDLYVARTIERANPRLRDELTAALQLAEDPAVHPGALAALRRRANRDTARSDTKSAVTLGGLKLSAIFLGAAILAFAGYCYFSQKPVLTSLRRILGDNSLATPTHTHIISVLPENEAFFQLEDAVRFTAVISKPDGAVTLKILRDPSLIQASENVETLRMEKVSSADEKNEGDTFIAVWPAVGSRASFQVLCGDAKTQWRMINILPPPAIRKISTLCKWPDYTGRGSVEQPGGRVEALAEAEVTVRADTNVVIRRASLDFEKSKKSLLMSISNDHELSTKFKLRTNDRYRVLFTGDIIPAEGKSIWYDVRVLDDKPPSVTLTQPIGEEIEITADDMLRLSGEAMDDFGLANAELVYLLGEQSRVVQLSKFKSPGPLGRPIDKRIGVSSLGQPGQELLCRVQVRDFRPMGIGKPTGQVGKSRQFRLRIKKAATEPELQQGLGESEEGERNGQAETAQQGKDKDKQQGQQGDKEQQDSAGDKNETQKQNDKDSDEQQGKQGDKEQQDGGEQQAQKEDKQKEQLGEQGKNEQENKKDNQQQDDVGMQEKEGSAEKNNRDQDQQNQQEENAGEEVFEKALEVAREDAEKLETLRQRLDEELNRNGQQKEQEQKEEEEQRNGQADSAQQEQDKDKQEEQQNNKEQQGKKEDKQQGQQEKQGEKEQQGQAGDKKEAQSQEEKGQEGQAGDKKEAQSQEEKGQEGQQGKDKQQGQQKQEKGERKDQGDSDQPEKAEGKAEGEGKGKDKQGQKGLGGEGFGQQGKQDKQKGQADSPQQKKNGDQAVSDKKAQENKQEQDGKGQSKQRQGSGGKGRKIQGSEQSKEQQSQQSEQKGQGDLQQQGNAAGGQGAMDLHSGDGDRKAESSSEVQTETDVDEELDEEFSKADAEKIESLGRAIDAANKQIRDNKIDPELLKELEMTESEFLKFVKKNTERYEKLQKNAAQRKEQTRGPDVIKTIGSGEVHKGDPRAETGNLTGGPAGEGQKDRQLRQHRSRRVSPKYQKKFEAFLRSVSEEPTTKPAEPGN
jgi:hypothetical protein